MQSEKLVEEFSRLVREYKQDDGPGGIEAWNLIADFAVDNAEAIEAALSAAEPQPAPSVAVKALQAIANYRRHSRLDSDENAEAMERIAKDALSAQVQDVAEERYRHKKRGSTYTVIARARLQVDGDLDNEKVVVYRGDDGQTWVRPEYEFNDGRFEPLPAAPAKQEG